MSPEMTHLAGADELAHERARTLAAESVDIELSPGDSEWLAGHLGSCPECATVAEEYRAIHLELRSLSTPEPPRDLWARTSAALDRIDAAAGARSRGNTRAARAGRRPLISTAIAVGFVVVVAVASLLVQSPIVPPTPASTRTSIIALETASSGQSLAAPQAPLALVDGTSYWIASDAGVYEIKAGSAQCSATDGSCTVAAGTGQTLGSIASDSTVSAVISPDARQAAVWTSDKVAILPLNAQPATVSMDLLTPRPTIAPTPTPSPTTQAQPAVPATASPAMQAATQAATPAESVPGYTPAPSPTPTATAAPASSPAATAPTVTQPVAILSGYEIVGRDPEFSADGSLVAFSARPVDHSTGPDVFVWRAGQEQAARITFRDSDLFAGWHGQEILISEISAGGSSGSAVGAAPGGGEAVGFTSYVYDPDTGTAQQIDQPMLLPAVDPTGQFFVYWSGTVEFDPVSGLWQPGKGDLFFDSWSDLTMTPASLGPTATPAAATSPTPTPAPPSAVATTSPPTPTPTSTALETPTAEPSTADTPEPSLAAETQSPTRATPSQLLPVTAEPGTVQKWIVRWDSSGRHVAVWVADAGSARIGRLSLFSIDRTTGLVDSNEPLLAADKVMSSIAFDDGHLVYTSAVDGKTYMQAVPAVPPSTVSTPVPTMPGQLPTGAAPSGSPAPQATDRPGN